MVEQILERQLVFEALFWVERQVAHEMEVNVGDDCKGSVSANACELANVPPDCSFVMTDRVKGPERGSTLMASG